MQESLGGFPEATKEIFREVQVSHKGDRFCFFLSENATEYVHEHRDENAFIFALVQLLAKHGTTLDEVKNYSAVRHLSARWNRWTTENLT